MKLKFTVAFLIAVSLTFLPSVANAKPRKGAKLKINVSKTKFKSSPRAFGAKIIATLERGEEVVFESEKGGFYKVKFDGKSGFIPSKSLIKSKKFKSFSRSAKVTSSDVSAATKGFSPEVEAKNRENKKLRYDLMDEAEKMSTVGDPEASLEGFRKKGKLGEYK